MGKLFLGFLFVSTQIRPYLLLLRLSQKEPFLINFFQKKLLPKINKAKRRVLNLFRNHF